jgi:hypothetical protein
MIRLTDLVVPQQIDVGAACNKLISRHVMLGERKQFFIRAKRLVLTISELTTNKGDNVWISHMVYKRRLVFMIFHLRGYDPGCEMPMRLFILKLNLKNMHVISAVEKSVKQARDSQMLIRERDVCVYVGEVGRYDR